MKCDLCDNEATVHEVSVQGGRQVDRHLCERCAAAKGLVARPPTAVPQILIQAVVKPGAVVEPEGAPGGATAGACDSCGQTFAQFRQSGLMGCPGCYAAFEGQLGPLLSRAHEGGTHHVGKTPRSAAGGKSPSATSCGPTPAPPAAPPPSPPPAPDTQARVAALRKQLAEAVAAEQYERAAALRDELRTLERPSAAPPATQPPATGHSRGRGARPAQGPGRSDPEGA